MINLFTPIQDVIRYLLECDRSEIQLFNNNENLTSLFLDLVKIGCDFFELLRIFCLSNNNFSLLDGGKICESLHCPRQICVPHEKNLRKMIPHWTASKYHSAPVEVVIQEILAHIMRKDLGNYVYHSNRNPKNMKAANDIYVLFVMKSGSIFIDLNRRKINFF